MEMTSSTNTVSGRQDQSREASLLALVRQLVGELQPQRVDYIVVSLTSRLERDLGIDSLGRTELILRIERTFGVRLPQRVLGEADTVGDLLLALGQAQPISGRIELMALEAVPALPPVSAAVEAHTLIDVLEWHAAQHADRLHVTVLQDDATITGTMTYGELARAARACAAGLIERDIVPGDRVALMLPTGTDFFIAFFGILYAGAVPVPIYPPMRLSQIEDHLRRQAGILRNAEARLLVTVPEGLRVGALLRDLVASINSIETAATLTAGSKETEPPHLEDGKGIALIQYTSGSTGDPKGVVLTHSNLLANIRSLGGAIHASSSDVVVSWLPLYHDMGLIGTWLACLYFGAPFYAMSPLSFLSRPESWLKAIHRFRATISAAPNFAYELCLNKIDDASLAGLDLSSLRLVGNGAEPVNVQTLQRFIERFGRYGFRKQAMAPVYGLAENTVALALPPPERGPIIDHVDRDALTLRGMAEPAKPGDPHAIEICACGQPLPDHEIRIVDNLGHEVGERQEGRLEFRGPSSTSGYFNNEPKTRALFRGEWLDSGDRAYMAGGDVFITGRIKDIIIRAGQNIYPQEVENAVAEIPGVRKGGVAMFGAADPSLGTERIVILAETKETEPAALELLRVRVRDAATDILITPPDEIVLVKPGTVPKTSSGKIRRSAARDLYAAKQLDVPQPAFRWQLLHLWLAGSGSKILRLLQHGGEMLFAFWWWLIMAFAFMLGVPLIMALPRLSWRWTMQRWVARAVFAVTGVPIASSGIERLPGGNALLVFNHASYIDVLLLAAVLPDAPAFVAKKEFAGQFFIGTFLRRLGALFVERYEAADSLADVAAVTEVARQGRNLVIFPEGTFTRRAGLSAFFLGAFKVAAEANLPVYPGVLRGTRSVLRADQWFPRRVPVAVEIGEAIAPAGTDFASLVRLRDAVRADMLVRCGEPDLGGLAKPMPQGTV